MLEVKSKRSPQPRGEAPVPPPSSRKRARKESSSIVVVQGTKGKAPWPKEASMELEKCVKASLDAGIPLRGEGGAFENGCKIHTRLGFKMHRKNRYNQPTKSIGCKCNASQDEWCDHIQPRLEADKDSWYMVGNYGNLLQKSRRKKPNTVDDEDEYYMSERDFGGTEDDSQTSEEDATDDSESSEEEEGELIPGSARVTASWIDFLKKHWLPLAEQYPQPNEIVRLFSEIDAHFRANGLYYDKDPLQVSILQDRIDEVKETVNQMYNAIDGIDPGGLTGYLTSSDIPSDEKRSSTSTSPTQRVPGSPPPSSETLQELTKGSFEKVINEVAPLIKEGASFIDIGCGRGNCCLHWKIFYPESKVAGVDRTNHRIQIAKEVAGKIGQDVSFSEEDAADEEGAIEYDVVYSFDKVFTDHDREAIYRRLNASPQWKVFVTFRTLKEGDLEGARLVSRLKLSVRQSTQKHTAYVYEKDRLLALYNKAVRNSQSVVE
jgi:16S rRNA G527 N7-methylase RsmG